MSLGMTRKEKVRLAFGIMFACLSELLFFYAALSYYSGASNKLSLFLAFVPFLIAAFILARQIVEYKDRPEVAFLLLGIPAGFAFALFLLPDQVPDERWHIYRAIDLRILGGGTTVPSCMESMPVTYSAYKKALSLNAAWNNTVWLERDLTEYFIHLYAVAHVVVIAFRAVGANPYIAIIVARIANGAIFISVGFLCIKNMPHAKIMFTIFMLNPMLLQQQFSISADSITNTACLAFISFLFWLKFEGRVSKKSLAILVGLGFLVSISKFAYAPLILFMLLLTPFIESREMQRRLCCCVFGAIFVVVAVLIGTYDEGSYQLTFELVRQPIELVRVLAKSLYEMGPLWVKQALGMCLGALNVTVWEPCFWLYAGILFASAVFNMGEHNSFSRMEKIFINVFSFCLFIAILLVFREWTINSDKRSDVIMGLQGRYLLPFIFPAFSTAVTPRSSLFRENCMVFYSASIAFVYFFSFLGVFYTFIG